MCVHLRRKGQSVVAHCYWDFGRWSDLWRAWRPLPDAGATFDECLMRTRTQEASLYQGTTATTTVHAQHYRTGHQRSPPAAAAPAADAADAPSVAALSTLQDATRWARILCELLREVWALSEKSAWVAHLELISKLQVNHL